MLVFLEDEDDPIGDDVPLKEPATPKAVKVHLHCRSQVKVRVTFNGKTVERLFGPGATIARVKRWAAQREFGMSEAEAGEHVLQLSGKHDRPAPGLDSGIVRFDGRYFGALWALCKARELVVVADIHVHPGGVGQSESDRAHPMISCAGHIALILPRFGAEPLRRREIGMYRYNGRKRWTVVPAAERRYFFHFGF